MKKVTIEGAEYVVADDLREAFKSWGWENTPLMDWLNNDSEEKPKKCVYILEMSNHSVKIGVATDFEKRHNTIMRSSGMEIVNWGRTDYISAEAAYKIESTCHKYFKDKRLKGEFFNITFAEACQELKKHQEIIDTYDGEGV